MKTKKLVGIIAAMTVILTGCSMQWGNEMNLPNGQELELRQITLEEYEMRRYNRTMETENAVYYFSAGLDADETELVRMAEIILQAARQDYGIQPLNSEKLGICFREDSVRNAWNEKTTYIELNPNDAGQQGMLLNFISGEKLPVWLCVGLERDWLKQYNELDDEERETGLKEWAQKSEEKGLPMLGDEWFVPGMIEDELREDAPAAAGQYVGCLKKRNQLKKLVESYYQSEQQKAEEIRIREWDKATGVDGTDPHGLTFRYLMSRDMEQSQNGTIMNANKNILFYVRAKEGTYYYSDTEDWTYQNAVDYATVGESSIEYVGDWFDYHFDQPLDVFYMVDDNSGHGMHANTAQKSVVVRMEKMIKAIDITHEIVHLTLSDAGLNKNTKGLYQDGRNHNSKFHFEEAICEVVSAMCSVESDDALLKRNSYLRCLKLLRAACGDEYVLQYLLTVISQNKDANKLEPMIWHDLLAISIIEQRNIIEKVETMGDKMQYLLDYDVVTSFFLRLLLEKGDKEDLMKIYEDISCVEEVYGATLNEMIDEWIEHLNRYVWNSRK